MPVLTLLCSLLDGSFHKHIICKVSVLYHCGPPSGLAPASLLTGAGGRAGKGIETPV